MNRRIFLLILGAALVLLSGGCRLLGALDQPAPQDRYLQQIVDINEDNPHALFLIAKNLLLKNKPAIAIAFLDDALKLEPNRVEFHIAKGAALEQMDNLSAAQRAYEKALALSPESAQTKIRLGRLAWKRGDIKTARQWAESVGETDDSADLWRLRGEIAYVERNYPEALKLWQESLSRDSSQTVLKSLYDDLAGYVQISQ